MVAMSLFENILKYSQDVHGKRMSCGIRYKYPTLYELKIFI